MEHPAMRAELSALLIGVVTCFLGIAEAVAQEAAPPPAGGPTREAVEPHLIRVPWDWSDILVLERRYKIEALSFWARDETGVDWPGSDEVMVGTRDPEGWTASDVIGDINSGDIHEFDPARSCLVGVSPGEAVLGRSSVCDAAGRPAPLWFEVELWEIDWSPPGFEHGCQPAPSGGHAGECSPPPLDYVADDFIGDARLEFTPQELEAALPRVGDQYTETVTLNPCGEDVCGSGWPIGGSDYAFTYRITRMPNKEIDMRDIIAASVERSGARSEMEAVIAGLNALQTPRPRPAEPGTGGPQAAADRAEPTAAGLLGGRP